MFLHLSDKFLMSLVWNDRDVEPTLIGYLPYIQHHLRKNLGSIEFLKEMYDNNKILLFNQVQVRSSSDRLQFDQQLAWNKFL